MECLARTILLIGPVEVARLSVNLAASESHQTAAPTTKPVVGKSRIVRRSTPFRLKRYLAHAMTISSRSSSTGKKPGREGLPILRSNNPGVLEDDAPFDVEVPKPERSDRVHPPGGRRVRNATTARFRPLNLGRVRCHQLNDAAHVLIASARSDGPCASAIPAGDAGCA